MARSGRPGPLRIQLRVEGQKEAAAMLKQLGVRAKDLRRAYDRIGRDYCDVNLAWWNSFGDGKWKYLRKTTQARKLRKPGPYPPRVPVYRTGDLKRSLTEYGAPHQIFKPTSVKLRFGTELPYAVYQQGRRPLLATPSPADLERWGQILAREIFAIKLSSA